MPKLKNVFRQFRSDVGTILLPQKFTYPFHYQPHPIAILATKELQEELEKDSFIQSLSGREGKMFGVLVVKSETGMLGYLAGFSGKLGSSYSYSGFVPPIFNSREENTYYAKEERRIEDFNHKIAELGCRQEYTQAQQNHNKLIQQFAREKEVLQQKLKEKKAKRSQIRKSLNATHLFSSEMTEKLIRESQSDKSTLRTLNAHWKQQIHQAAQKVATFEKQIEQLKRLRKQKSTELQDWLFKQYIFWNASNEEKNLLDIFKQTRFGYPPSAAGDCAAPKLLQYALTHNLRPIALAEFWWGANPKSKIRKHRYFYPCCKGKCEPILHFMLKGLEVDPNPLLATLSAAVPIEVLYEDDAILVVNKPAGLLSVPGIEVQDSLFERMRVLRPESTELTPVHRLDKATSGLLIFTKEMKYYKALQQQFIQNKVQKRYTALLDGFLTQKQGEINLPLRVDLNDRPRQLVCQKHGKRAQTFWETVEETERHTRVSLFPITGRTHQLRVHCAHPQGLGMPILGDELYGRPEKRLYLHAEFLSFTHPVTRQQIEFFEKAPF